MTDITDAEAAEVLWASSREGMAAVKAAWDRAKQLGIAGHPVVTGRRPIDMADIGAIVYAAYLAAPDEPGGNGGANWHERHSRLGEPCGPECPGNPVMPRLPAGVAAAERGVGSGSADGPGDVPAG